MRYPEGESDHGPLRPLFFRPPPETGVPRIAGDLRRGVARLSRTGDALGPTALACGVVADSRTGRNGWHGIVGLLRQPVHGRLAGYEDVNDADRLGRDPAMRWIVGGKAVERGGASTGQMGRFETELLLSPAVRVQPVRRPGALRAAPRQRAQRHQCRHSVPNHPDRREDGCHSKANARRAVSSRTQWAGRVLYGESRGK